MTFDELRAQFPSAEKCLHLNHAGTSPIARPVATAMQAVSDELMSGDIFTAYVHHEKRQDSLRNTFARMLTVPAATLGFTRNTSHGLTIIAQAIRFQPGNTVVLPAIEYPANVYPWMAQAHRGVNVLRVPARPDGLISEDDLMAACESAHARVLAVSWVQWGTGQRLDLARLGSFCRQHGILFSVDIVQGLGAIRLNLSETPVDFAAAGCHKWLLAPGGVGLLYVHPDRLDDLLPTNIGWNSVANSIDWENLHYDEMKPGTSRFEEGTPNLPGTAALGASVALLEEAGFDAVHQRVLTLAGSLRAGLLEHGYHVVTPPEDDRRSGIIAFRHPSLPNDSVLRTLKAQGIIAAVRCGQVRFAPHAYLSEEDCARGLAGLPG